MKSYRKGLDAGADVHAARARVRVNHRRSDVDVTEDILDRANIDAALQQVGCVSMAQPVRRGYAQQPDLLGRTPDDRLQALLVQPPADRVTEARVRCVSERRSQRTRVMVAVRLIYERQFPESLVR